jgi:hypothetical protein
VISLGAGPLVTGQADSLLDWDRVYQKSKKANGSRLEQHDKSERKKASVGELVVEQSRKKGKENAARTGRRA